MKRKNHTREEQARETRRKILKAAVKLFARQGYHKTTISDIAMAIDLTSGAIFHHFSAKDAILDAVVEWLARGMKVYSNAADRAESGSLNLVRDTIRIMCDHFKRNPEATICLAALATEFAGGNHPVEARLKGVYDAYVDSFSRTLKNHPKVTDPRAAAIAFLGAVQGIAIQGLLREREQNIDQLAEAFISMMTEW